MDGRNKKLLTAPIILALGGATLLFAMLLYWSAQRTDEVSLERQEQLVSRVLAQSIAGLEHEQEASTISDRSIEKLEAPIVDLPRLDDNFGPWAHAYYGHDESYMVARDDRPIYAARDRKRVDASEFENARAAAMPLVAELRAKMRALPLPEYRKLSTNGPGVTDLAVINGHPAIISVKPLLPHTQKLRQEPGREFIYVSVRRLDGTFLHNLRENYLFTDARFAWKRAHGRRESALPFTSPRTGREIGYLVWKPVQPGAVVLKDTAPAMALMMALTICVVWLLLNRIRRSTAELQASEAQAKHLAFHDPLTGLPNRALYDDRLERALGRARREPEEGVALLFIDLDRFKQVNDTLGHAAGDELIRAIGTELNRAVRGTDTVARLGGDEFAVVQAGIRSEEDVALLCQRLLKIVEKPFELVGSQVFVGMSIGVALAGKHGLDREELSRKADIALYHVKAHGRGDYAVFEEAMDATVQVRQSVEQDLRAAMETTGQLAVHYQPKYDAVTREVSGVEALLRWNHPERGTMCPSVFIPIAEESGLIDRLGEWVLQQAVLAGRDWPLKTISVNVSAIQLRSQLFAPRVLKILHTAGMDPARLEFELTESAFMENLDQCRQTLAELRAGGVRLALDDFGTGYSSFSHLHDHEIDRLKIDRSFISSIRDSQGSAIIRAIIQVARAVGIQITAEGVETMEQSDFLSAAGCDELQGFLMSKAVPAADIDALLGFRRTAESRKSLAA